MREHDALAKEDFADEPPEELKEILWRIPTFSHDEWTWWVPTYMWQFDEHYEWVLYDHDTEVYEDTWWIPAYEPRARPLEFAVAEVLFANSWFADATPRSDLPRFKEWVLERWRRTPNSERWGLANFVEILVTANCWRHDALKEIILHVSQAYGTPWVEEGF